MTIRWSRLHALLGEAPGPLTYDFITSAVAAGLAETDDLDWKSILTGKEEAQLEEFAKDVAAMANSGGGLIVYGVNEKKQGTGQADGVQSVDVSEGAQRRLRALAASRIHPAVAGLDFVPLTSPDGLTSVLVLVVPRSADAPHMIGQGAKIGVPFRSGPETQWMRERDLERAYSDRFTRRVDERTRLMTMTGDIADQVDFGKGAWMVGVARPRTPLPTVAGPPARADITKVLESALATSIEIAPTGARDRYALLRELGQAAFNPRVGLRRWIAQTLPSTAPDDRCNMVHAELHHDGSVGFAVALEGWFAPVITDRHQVVCPLVESICADFVALVESYSRYRGETVPASLRIDLLRPNESMDFAALDIDRQGSFTSGDYAVVKGTRTVRRFTPVDGEIPVAFDTDTLRAAAREAAQDVLHQFGMAGLAVLK